MIKKKNKKKIGSNAKNLGKLEPQPEQTFLIKKKLSVNLSLVWSLGSYLIPVSPHDQKVHS